MCDFHFVPPLPPVARMTEEEERLLALGKSCQVYHSTIELSEYLFSMPKSRWVDYISHAKRDLFLNLADDLFKKGLYFEQDNSEIPGDRTIRVSIVCAKPGNKSVESLVEKNYKLEKEVKECRASIKKLGELLQKASKELEAASCMELFYTTNLLAKDSEFLKMVIELKKELEKIK